jgi:hypothetical protein
MISRTVAESNAPSIARNKASADVCRSILDRLGDEYQHAGGLRHQIDLLEATNAKMQAAIDAATPDDNLKRVIASARFGFDEIVRRNFRNASARVRRRMMDD